MALSMRNPGFLPTVGILLLASLLWGCGPETAQTTTTVMDSAGVTVVTAPGEDVPLGWTAERLLEIPAADTEDEGFFGITDLGVLEDGRIAVLDGDGKKVVLFDDQGTFLSQYGREGSGPGEFRYPLDLIPTPAGGFFVYDMMNGRFERFDAELTPLAPEPLRVSYFGGNVAFAGKHLVLPLRDLENPEMEVTTLTAILEPDTVDIVRYERPQGGAVEFKSCGMALSGITPLFSPRTRWAEGFGGLVAVAGTTRYEVDVYRGPTFQLERRIRRNVEPLRATKEMAEAEVGEGMRVMTPAGERICEASEVVEEQGFASEVPPISRVAISPAGEFFLERWAPRGEDRAIDILSPQGEYMGTLAPGFPFPAAFLDQHRILVEEEDEMEVPSVVIYRIVR